MEQRTDSMRAALDDLVDARQDSVDMLREQADRLEDSATAASTVQRRSIERGADSVRAQMRALGDRLRQDEARLAAFDEVSGLSAEELDSLALMGQRMNDSVQREVARTLRRVQAEVERATTATSVTPPAPPAPPKP
jgi:hypothetical protein